MAASQESDIPPSNRPVADAVTPRPLFFDWSARLRGVWSRTEIRWLVVILILALAVRLIWVGMVQPDPREGRFDDSVWFFLTGQGLADGEGYHNPFVDAPTAKWSVGYPLLLSAVNFIPGDDVAAARGLNIAASLLTVAVVYYLGQRLWDKRAGLLAAALIAFFPSHIFFSTLVMTEVVFTALSVSVLALALAWTMSGATSRRRLVLLGVVVAAAALVRPEGMILAAVLAVAWLLVHRSWRRAAYNIGFLVVGIAILILPWTVRNIVQLDSLVVSTTGLGGVLIQGHHPAADGRPSFLIQAELEAKFADVELPEQEVRINNAGIRESISYAVENPRRELELIPRRFVFFVRGDRGAIDWVQLPFGPEEQRTLSSTVAGRLGMLADVYYYIAIGFALAGLPLVLKRRRPEHLLLLLPVAVYGFLWSAFFVSESRYHFPLLPILSLAAAMGASAGIAWLQQQRDQPNAASVGNSDS